MTIAMNLATGEEMTFDRVTTPEYAVAYGYCQENNLLSWFFASVHDAAEQKRATPLWREKLEFIYGQRSVACGNWAALT